MADEITKEELSVVDAIFDLLPDDPEEAFGISTAVCAASTIDAGVDDEAAVRGLRTALTSLRNRGAGERRH